MAGGHAIFLFTRDLRLADNHAWREAARHSRSLSPVFVFQPRQLPPRNEYAGPFALRFLIEAVSDLENTLSAWSAAPPPEFRQNQIQPLVVARGELTQQLDQLAGRMARRGQPVDSLYLSRDYTPFARHRMDKLVAWGKGRGLKTVRAIPNHLLTEPEDVFTGQGSPYRVFTPFYRRARQLPVPKPEPEGFKGKVRAVNTISPWRRELEKELAGWLEPARNSPWTGNRRSALELLERVIELAGKNEGGPGPIATAGASESVTTRSVGKEVPDLPAAGETSYLSAALKFGLVSVREVAHGFQQAGREDLVRQLYWRDFYTHIAWHWPEVFGKEFQARFRSLRWRTGKAAQQDFDRWAHGNTGFPLVDAAQRCLRQTGFMPGRLRMVVASFLVKDLGLDWRRGEKFFARYLVDYDPSVNNGNWQWAASTGCDAQPWFRVFNPWRQQEKFDPETRFIRAWVPELAEVSAREIHRREKMNPASGSGGQRLLSDPDYPAPMVDHKKQAAFIKEIFSAAQK